MMVLTGVLISGAVGCRDNPSQKGSSPDNEISDTKPPPRPDPRFRPPPGKKVGGPP